MRGIAAAAGVALIALLTVPTAAFAGTAPVEGPELPAAISVPISGPVALEPGTTGQYTVPPGTFGAGQSIPEEPVTITLTGTDASSATLASAVPPADVATTSRMSAIDGSLEISVTLPADATGEYTLTAVGEASQSSGTIVIAAETPEEAPVEAPPVGEVTGPTTLAAGSSADYTFAAGTFGFGQSVPVEPVTLTLTGEDATAGSLASAVRAVTVNTISKVSAVDGSLVVTVTLPASATGTYTLRGVGEASQASGSITITATAAPAPTTPPTAAPAPTGTSLADTGSGAGPLFAVGASVLALGAVLGVAVVARRRAA